MAKGIKPDLRNIRPYQLADQDELRYQVRVKVHGTQLCKSFADLQIAQQWRDAQLEQRSTAASREQVKLPEREPRSTAPRTVLSFLHDEWWPYALTRYPRRALVDRRGTIKRLIAPYPELAGMDPAKVEPDDIKAWFAWAREEKMSEDSLRKATGLLSAAYTWAVEERRRTGIRENPVRLVTWPNPERAVDPFFVTFTVTEWCRQWILHLSTGRSERQRRRNALLFAIMQGTGIRPGEARQLEAGMLDDWVLNIPARISKTRKARSIPLWSPTREDLSEYIDDYELGPGDPLIPDRTGKAMSFTGWERWVDDIWRPTRDDVAEQLELGAKDPFRSARAYDVCRHRYARAQLAALVPVPDLAEYMGHSVETLSRVYSGPITGARESVRRRLDPYDPEAELTAARAEVEIEMAKLLAKREAEAEDEAAGRRVPA